MKVCLSLLVGRGIVERHQGDCYRLREKGLSREAIAAAGRSYRDKEEQDRENLQRMIDYAESSSCRWQALLTYFDDDALMVGPCLHCDNDPSVPDEIARLSMLRKCVEEFAAVQENSSL